MAYDDDLGRALDEADNRGTIDFDNEDSVRDFTDRFSDLMGDREEVPDASQLSKEEQDEWMEFFDEYELWDEFREDWERYLQAA